MTAPGTAQDIAAAVARERAIFAACLRSRSGLAAKLAEAGRVDADGAAVFIHWAEALAEMVEQGLHDDAAEGVD